MGPRRAFRACRVGAAAALAAFAGWGRGPLRSMAAAERASAPETVGTSEGRTIGVQLPGAPALEPALVARLERAWASRDPAYKPRTRHLRPDGSPKYMNRLFLESSPYLLQHAHNPVSWYPWGDEAFATARRQGRPVLLSVGYSTCHWCHVMEEESFEDEEVARVLNESYVAIKVDREERPDVDAVYMSAVQALTGGGGWPMTVWLAPDRRPFFGGTYVPARDGDRGVPVGFLTLLRRLRQAFDAEPDRLAQASSRLSQAIRESFAPTRPGDALPGAPVLEDAARRYSDEFDPAEGGLRRAPRFPADLPIRFLLRYHRRRGEARFLEMPALTLEKMAASGMRDHIGGGFHRYSTDAHWIVPHFEKMLYDNALLAVAYLEGYQATGREEFARVAREILLDVERDMTSPEGAFYSAIDADSLDPGGHRAEGRFFTWTADEIEAALGREPSRIVSAYYAVTPAGNFEGRSILHRPRSLADVARGLGLPPDEVRAAVEESKERLYAARARRPRPLRDEKILAAWNGLMIAAYARAALILGEEAYARRAERAAEFVLTRMRRDGLLLRSYKDGRAIQEAYLDDYAFLISGLLDLYEATGRARWVKEALSLDRVLEERFEDSTAGGYFMTSADHEALIARQKPAFDGAEPSGNSVHALNLLRLYELTTRDGYRRRAERTLLAFSARLSDAPTALSEMLLAVDFHLDTPKEIVIVATRSRQEAEPFLARFRATFLPNRVLAVVSEGDDLAAHARLVPLVERKTALRGRVTAYVCERGVCELPTNDPAVFDRQIRKVESLGPSKGK